VANPTSRSSGVGVSSLPKQPVWIEAGKSRNEAIDTVKKWNTGQGKTAKQFNSEQVRVTNDDGSEIIQTKRVSGGKIAMLACATCVFASTLREFWEKNPNAVHNIEFTEDVTGNKCFKRAFLIEPNLAHAMLHNKIRITTIDAGHISHKLYTGVAMLLKMMDGNVRLFPVAAAIAPTES